MITHDSTTLHASTPIDTLVDAATSAAAQPVAISEEQLVAVENTIEGLFGPSAALVEQSLPEAMEQVALSGNWVVGATLVALFIYYLFVLFAYGGHIGLMGKVMLSNNLGIRVADELSYLFMRAVRNAVTLGIVAWSLIFVKWIGMSGEGEMGQAVWLLPMTILVCLGVGLVQRMASNFIFSLTLRREVREGVNIMADTTMALTAIIVTPVSLLLAVNMGQSVATLSWVCLVTGAVAMTIFCIKSLILFIGQKISILLWFLYLCTVILIPIGVVITLVVRSGAA